MKHPLQRHACAARIGTLLPLAFTAALLAGCGGGGGDGGDNLPPGGRVVVPSAASDVTAGNFGSIGHSLARAVLAGADSSLLGVTGASGTTRESPMTLRSEDNAKPWAAQWVMRALQHAPRATTGREQAQVVHTQTAACTYGGSITFSVNDADNNNALSAGDSVSFTSAGCVEVFGDPPLNGGFSMTVNSVVLDANQNPVSLDVSGMFNQMTVAGLGSMNGAFRLQQQSEVGGDRLRLSYNNLTITAGGETIVAQHDIVGLFSATGGSFELQGGLEVGGQTYAFVPNGPLVFVSGQAPHSGSVRLRDAAGDAVELIARDALTYDLGHIPAGAAAAVATLLGQLWSALST